MQLYGFLVKSLISDFQKTACCGLRQHYVNIFLNIICFFVSSSKLLISLSASYLIHKSLILSKYILDEAAVYRENIFLLSAVFPSLSLLKKNTAEHHRKQSTVCRELYQRYTPFQAFQSAVMNNEINPIRIISITGKTQPLICKKSKS